MKLSNKTYDTLKWVALICLPALQVFWLSIGKIWNIDYTVEIGATIGAVALFLGTLLGVSSSTYTNELTEAEAMKAMEESEYIQGELADMEDEEDE